jgi:hypothetical protein
VLRQVGWIRTEDYVIMAMLVVGSVVSIWAGVHRWLYAIILIEAVVLLTLAWAVFLAYRLGYFAVQLLTLVKLLPDKAAMIVTANAERTPLDGLEVMLQAKLPKPHEVWPALREVGWARWQDLGMIIFGIAWLIWGAWHVKNGHLGLAMECLTGTAFNLAVLLAILSFRFSFFIIQAIADLNTTPAQVLHLLAQFERRV